MRGCDKAGAGGHPPGRLGVGLSLLSEDTSLRVQTLRPLHPGVTLHATIAV
jgi:hypothetical protein